MESYVEVFEQEGALECLEGFTSEYGAEFYGLPLNMNSISLVKKPFDVPNLVEVRKMNNASEHIVPFQAGESLGWSVMND